MFVRNHMISKVDVITIQESESLASTLEKMAKYGHDALPVAEGDHIVGIISKQHIYKMFFLGNFKDKGDFLETAKVAEQMKTDFKTALEWDILETAVQTMANMHTQFLPVISSEGRFVGLLTKQRLLEALGNSLGLGKRGIRIEIALDDSEGRLAALAKIIARLGINIISFTMVDPHVLHLQTVVMRLDTKELDKVVTAIEEGGFKVLHSFVEE